MARAWIDISMLLTPGMPQWPGDPVLRLKRTRSHGMSLTHVAMTLHTGTHVDAPAHFLPSGAGIETMPLDAMVGPARVLAIRDPVSVEPAELERHRIRRGERILLKTRNSKLAGAFCPDYVSISPEAARWLAARRLRMVGIDYLSVGSFHCGEETHRILLAGGVWILEGLKLAKVAPGRYDLICLPLNVPGADGAPARALLRRR